MKTKYKIPCLLSLFATTLVSISTIVTSCASGNVVYEPKLNDKVQVRFKNDQIKYGNITEILDVGLRINNFLCLYSDIQSIDPLAFKIGDFVSIILSKTSNVHGVVTEITDDFLKMNNNSNLEWLSIQEISRFHFSVGDIVHIQNLGYGTIKSIDGHGLTLDNNRFHDWSSINIITRFQFNFGDWVIVNQRGSGYTSYGHIVDILGNGIKLSAIRGYSNFIYWKDIYSISLSEFKIDASFEVDDVIKVKTRYSNYIGLVKEINTWGFVLSHRGLIHWYDYISYTKVMDKSSRPFVNLNSYGYGQVLDISDDGITISGDRFIEWSLLWNFNLFTYDKNDWIELITENNYNYEVHNGKIINKTSVGIELSLIDGYTTLVKWQDIKPKSIIRSEFKIDLSVNVGDVLKINYQDRLSFGQVKAIQTDQLTLSDGRYFTWRQIKNADVTKVKISIGSYVNFGNNGYGKIAQFQDEGIMLSSQSLLKWNKITSIDLFEFKVNDFIKLQEGTSKTHIGTITDINDEGLVLSLDNNESLVRWSWIIANSIELTTNMFTDLSSGDVVEVTTNGSRYGVLSSIKTYGVQLSNGNFIGFSNYTSVRKIDISPNKKYILYLYSQTSIDYYQIGNVLSFDMNGIVFKKDNGSSEQTINWDRIALFGEYTPPVEPLIKVF